MSDGGEINTPDMAYLSENATPLKGGLQQNLAINAVQPTLLLTIFLDFVKGEDPLIFKEFLEYPP